MAAIAATEDVRVLHAIESGSRAWGFPSPDSDYDCRFIYARACQAYLSLWPARDVIELPIIGLLDINGWDLAKALRLLLKGNAVVVEWLTSPVVYRSEPGAAEQLLELAKRHVDRGMVARHYLHLGLRQRERNFGDGSDVAIKRLFYALRPAAALRWLRLHPGESVAPMHFPTLMSECDPPRDVRVIVADLIARKAVTNELGRGPIPPDLARFIDHEFEVAQDFQEGPQTSPSEEARADADALFQSLVG